jgi:hypothetical protein
MGLLARILIGLAIVAVGVFMVIKTRMVIDFLGTNAWADAKLGGGGTSLLYKLIAILVTCIGFMVATNLWNAFLQATLGSFFGMNRTPGE